MSETGLSLLAYDQMLTRARRDMRPGISLDDAIQIMEWLETSPLVELLSDDERMLLWLRIQKLKGRRCYQYLELKDEMGIKEMEPLPWDFGRLCERSLFRG